MGKKFISEFKFNEQVDSFFMLLKKELKMTKYDKPYLQLTLSDRTGKIEGRLWDDAARFNEMADAGDVAHVKGVVEKYREEKQLKVDLLAKADERAFRFEDMVRVAQNRDKVEADIRMILEGFTNPWLKSLAEAFLGDTALMAAFRDAIGGKMWHNAYIGGLMEHTYEVMCIVERMAGLYPQMSRELALMGAFMHDIGKIEELDPRKMEYTDQGNLIGHIILGHKILINKISLVQTFPADLAMRLEHMILSHHGEYEHQSPVLPKTLEATVVYQADELASQANAVKEIIQNEASEGKNWSQFYGIKNRKYFIRDHSGEDWGVNDARKERPFESKGKEAVPEAPEGDSEGDLFT
ncbi:MAG: HD domain-containing protein [Candidatus Omnitrophica bacterium]|nr:HD domain-containing protein [Candidatus Omnitrophota bacterium]MDD4013046.1 HD domain-containing protein [Candidatus Omnitrophota bacterium]